MQEIGEIPFGQMPSAISHRRLTSLDALRGIASVVVVASHCYLLLPEGRRAVLDASWAGRLLLPLYNGTAAVVVFFVLSGFVLSLSYGRGSAPSYPRFVVRRFCRIYLPFAASILVALALWGLAGPAAVPGASAWFNELWPRVWPGASVIAGHFAMAGLAPTMRLNPVMWSLVYELRLSLVLPLLLLLCRDSRVAVAAGFVLLLAPIRLLNLTGGSVHPSFAATAWETALWSVQLSAYFVTGILLAKHAAWLHAAWARLPRLLRPALALLPVLAFCCRPALNSGKTVLLYDLGAAALVALAILSPQARRVLDTALPQWLGRVSYSLYLVHLPVILALYPVLAGRMPFAAASLLLLAASLTAAAVLHRLVEAPATRLGRRLTRPRATDADRLGVNEAV